MKAIVILLASTFALAGLSGCMSTDSSFNSAASSSISAASLPNNAALLSWTAAAGEQDGFRVEQSTDGVNFSLAASAADGTLSATINGLTPGHLYYFRIYGYNGAGNSPYSPVVTLQL